MKPSISAELENGIEDTPVFHWFVVFIVFICLCFSLSGPWWVQAVPGLILLRVLAWHRAFFTRTTVKATDRIIEISRVTPLGRRTTVLDFDEIAEVRVQVKRWGDYDSRQVRETLLVCTLNQSFSVIYSSQDSQRINRLVGELREALGLAPDFKDVPPLEDPTTLTSSQAEALEALCTNAVRLDRVLGPDDISPELREKIAKHTGLPNSEPIWCYIDTSLAFKGMYGLAIGARGLYWSNDADLREHTKLSRLSWGELGTHTLAMDPADSDIMVSTTSQIATGLFSKPQSLLALLLALQKIVNPELPAADDGDDGDDEGAAES